MKKQLLTIVVLSAIWFAAQIQDASAGRRNPAIFGHVSQNVKFSTPKMPVLLYVGTLIDPFDSLYTFKLYGSGGVITTAYIYYGGSPTGNTATISNGLYHAETGNQLGWYVDQGTITTSFVSFSFFEALYADLS